MLLHETSNVGKMVYVEAEELKVWIVPIIKLLALGFKSTLYLPYLLILDVINISSLPRGTLSTVFVSQGTVGFGQQALRR